jgi:hypothetical protein
VADYDRGTAKDRNIFRRGGDRTGGKLKKRATRRNLRGDRDK